MELVHRFCYLGSHVKADDGSELEVHRHVAIARDCICISSLQRRIWKTGIRTDTKLRMMYILPILLYGAET